MSRGTRRFVIAVMALVSVLLLVSPCVFSKPFVKIDDEGLRSIHIRADILKQDGPSGHGPKHGRVQIMVREIAPEVYSYKFMIDFKKASPNKEYNIELWVVFPEPENPEDDVLITIYGEDELGNIWHWIKLAAVLFLKIDLTPGNPNQINFYLNEALTKLGLTEDEIVMPTGMTIMTDETGNFKSIKEGIISEDDAMEYVLDLIWPFLRSYLVGLVPPQFLPDEIDFDYLGVTGVKIRGGEYSVSGGMRFIGEGDGQNPENPVDIYYTETVTIDRVWNDFIWGYGLT
jgi:hypothetical protein